MFLTEYNEEEARKCMQEESYEDGMAQGIAQGMVKGEDNIKNVLSWLKQQNRTDDIMNAISDDSYMERLKKEYDESQK